MNDALQRFSFRTGNQVLVDGWPPSTVLKVVDTSDNALLTLRTPNGVTVRVGRLAVKPPTR